MKILVVCLGNICRSPMAEGILRKQFDEAGLDAVYLDSAGTSDYHIDEAPDHRAIAKAAEYDIDISQLRGRQLVYEDFQNFDRIYVMDTSNYQNALELCKTEEDRNKLDLFLNLSYPNENRSVPDPYFGGESGFEQVYQLLENAGNVLVKELKNE